MSRTALTFREQTVKDVKVYHIDGKILGDNDTEELCNHIKKSNEEDSKYFVMNFRRVKWINSLGLGNMMSCLTSIRNRGGDLRLANVHDAAMKSFKITRFDALIKIFDTIDEAVDSFGP